MTFKKWLLVEGDFDSWFNGSKMANKKTGKPDVYYHGSRTAGFTKFDPNKSIDGTFYFSPNSGVGDNYATSYEDDETPGVYPVHLNMKKPLAVGKPITPSAMTKMLKAASQLGVILNPTEVEELKADPYVSYWSVLQKIRSASPHKDIAKQVLSAMGYDGILASADSVQAFDPKQIKSVFARNYDPGSEEIV